MTVDINDRIRAAKARQVAANKAWKALVNDKKATARAKVQAVKNARRAKERAAKKLRAAKKKFEEKKRTAYINTIITKLRKKIPDHVRVPLHGSIQPTGIAIYGFKSVQVRSSYGDWTGNKAILLLAIPSRAARFRGDFNRGKCRASQAIPIGVVHSTCKITSGLRFFSGFDRGFEYVLGQKAVPTNGYSNSKQSCAGGIHFWATVKDARKWASI